MSSDGRKRIPAHRIVAYLFMAGFTVFYLFFPFVRETVHPGRSSIWGSIKIDLILIASSIFLSCCIGAAKRKYPFEVDERLQYLCTFWYLILCIIKFHWLFYFDFFDKGPYFLESVVYLVFAMIVGTLAHVIPLGIVYLIMFSFHETNNTPRCFRCRYCGDLNDDCEIMCEYKKRYVDPASENECEDFYSKY